MKGSVMCSDIFGGALWSTWFVSKHSSLYSSSPTSIIFEQILAWRMACIRTGGSSRCFFWVLDIRSQGGIFDWWGRKKDNRRQESCPQPRQSIFMAFKWNLQNLLRKRCVNPMVRLIGMRSKKCCRYRKSGHLEQIQWEFYSCLV